MALSQFKNETFLDFANKKNRKKQIDAINQVRKKFGKEYPIIVDGKKIFTKEKFKSYNPSDVNEMIGVFQKSDAQLANESINVALKTFETWKNVSSKKRAEYLFNAAKVIRRRRFEFNALLISEVGKSWIEADGDTCETIDFLEFYGREMLRYSETQPLIKTKGEKNQLVYIPLGVGVIIPPWNFPLAILVGMTTAAIVCGNTVVLKPSSDSPRIGYAFMEVMEEIKLPKGVINFLTGSGGEVGDTLVKHPKTRFVSFTGSMEVGIHINEEASKVQEGQIWLKRVVAEMGGKDCIVIENDANIDEAVAGVVASAFGFQGQKCSACSRVIVNEKIYDKVVQKLVEKAKTISVGNPVELKNYMGPLINKKSLENALKYIQKAVEEGGKIFLGGNKIESNGNFLEPTIISNVKPNDTIAHEEIFAPVLAVIKSKNFEDALKIANNTKYGLTGSIYTKNKTKLKIAAQSFFVGNLYFNRKCTGAFVGVHPFGGFNMSGTDSKAGGRDYLLLFLQAKLMSEKI